MNEPTPARSGPPASGSRVPDPYQIFFPLGVVAGLLGVSIWPAYGLGWIESVPSVWHVDLQLQGFLFAFVLGFLLTALPRLSITRHATWPELVFFLVGFVGGNAATVSGFYGAGRAGYLVTVVGLIVYALRRFRKRAADPPPEFVLVGIGLLFALVAGSLRLVALQVPGLAQADVAGRRLLSEGMMLFLVLGVGGRLAPVLFGLGDGSSIDPRIGQKSGFTRRHAVLLLVALALAMSFVLEYLASQTVALWLRAMAASAVFFGVMKIHRKPVARGVLVRVLRVSTWAILLSLWGSAIHPVYRVEVLHVMFIGGFAAMILAIATRVTLSHGNHPIAIEQRSASLAIASVLLIAATVARSIAPLFPELYFSLLGLAGSFWIAALLIWGTVFSRRALRRRPAPG